MKKKNLNFLLALLAALALVFAGACSDGSDSETNTETEYIEIEYEYESDYSGTTYTYTSYDSDTLETTSNHVAASSSGTTSAVRTLGSVSLAFAESGNGVDITVEYISCAYTSETHDGDTVYTATIEGAKYTALGSRVGIVLPVTDATSETSELTFIYTAATLTDAAKLTLAGVSSTPETATYTVKGKDTSGTEDTTGIDLFTATTDAGGLSTDTGEESEFELES